MTRTLKQAEKRLESTLKRLDGLVIERIQQPVQKHTADDYAATIEKYQSQMDGLHQENKHLREELQAAQSRVGDEQQQLTNYQKICDEAVGRIDDLIVNLNEKVA